jgi:hypothetical protein
VVIDTRLARRRVSASLQPSSSAAITQTVFQLIQSRVKRLNLTIERVKLLLIPVDLACILITENTNLLTEHSDSLLDLSEISIRLAARL